MTLIMKNFKKSIYGLVSIFAIVIACTDLEEELVSDFTEGATIPGVTIDIAATDGSSQAVQDQIGAAFENFVVELQVTTITGLFKVFLQMKCKLDKKEVTGMTGASG